MEEQAPVPPARFPWGAVIGVVVLAIVGLGMLGYAMMNLLGPAATPTAVASATLRPTQPVAVVVIPTATLAPTSEPSPTAAPTSAAPPTPTVAESVVTIVQPANIRSGPGANYTVLGGLAQGATAPALGRDSTGQWFVISYAAAAGGQGWVSNIVASYNGDLNGLPVVSAPPAPPTAVNPTAAPAATAAPGATSAPTSPPASYTVRGLRAEYFNLESTSAAPGQMIWFNFKVVNTTDAAVNYGVLAGHTDVPGQTAQSWANSTIQAHGVLEWRDHIDITAAGTYQVYLGICFAYNEVCMAYNAPWERLSPNVTVTIR